MRVGFFFQEETFLRGIHGCLERFFLRKSFGEEDQSVRFLEQWRVFYGVIFFWLGGSELLVREGVLATERKKREEKNRAGGCFAWGGS